MQSYRDLLDRLTRAHPSLSPQVRKAAAYILENPSDVATLSMRKVAAAAQVPPPTLPRLAKTLGFETYEGLREVYRQSLRKRSIAYSEEAGRLQERGDDHDMSSLWQAFQQASQANIQDLFASIDSSLVVEVADSLLQARRVYVAGMQASFSAAAYFQYVGAMAHPDWILLRNANGVLADRVVSLGSRDALVAIAIRPCANDTIRLAQLARERGATVVGLTDSRATPLAARADFVLTVPTQSPQFFESYVAATALLEALIGVVVARSSQDVVRNIERVEQARRELGEYWSGD